MLKEHLNRFVSFSFANFCIIFGNAKDWDEERMSG